jgi:hypothetical protein
MYFRNLLLVLFFSFTMAENCEQNGIAKEAEVLKSAE